MPEEWQQVLHSVVSWVVEEYIVKRFAGLPLPAPEELVGSYISPSEFQEMRRHLDNENGTH